MGFRRAPAYRPASALLQPRLPARAGGSRSRVPPYSFFAVFGMRFDLVTLNLVLAIAESRSIT
jgi:hypothetical protein